MMNKYLKSHITAAAFCAGVFTRVLFHFREPRTMRLFMQSGRLIFSSPRGERTLPECLPNRGGVHHFFRTLFPVRFRRGLQWYG